MDNKPLVSIVAINYNNNKYVIETLDSIASQTYENIELIIVDDCSVDDSVELIEQWLVDYKKPYQFIKHSKNEGVCKTINDGYRRARGKYISSIATDDIMLPEKIEVQVELLEDTDDSVGMVYSDAYLINEKSDLIYGRFIQRYKPYLTEVPSGNIYEELLKRNYIPAMSIMIKNKIFASIGYFDEYLNYEDYDMWLRIAKDYHIIYSDFVSVKYRIRKNSLSTDITPDLWTLNDIKIYKKHKDFSEIAFNSYTSLVYRSFFNNRSLIHSYLNEIDDQSFNFMRQIWNFPYLPHKIKIRIYNYLRTNK